MLVLYMNLILVSFLSLLFLWIIKVNFVSWFGLVSLFSLAQSVSPVSSVGKGLDSESF